jgi:Predicted oxidoreductases of the aldo/keto reductase family
MRFQQSWTDLAADAITHASQQQLEATLRRAVACGFHHVETARHYGSSERQLGWALPQVPDAQRILQTKIPPKTDAAAFEQELSLSVERLGGARIDLLAIHGINRPDHLEQTLRPRPAAWEVVAALGTSVGRVWACLGFSHPWTHPICIVERFARMPSTM